jgi:hypothetical protein
LTDGEDDNTEADLAVASAGIMSNAGGCARLDTIGLGSPKSAPLLKAIATAGGGLYHYASGGQMMSGGMRNLLATIEATAVANVVVRVQSKLGTRIIRKDGFPCNTRDVDGGKEITVGHLGVADPILLPLLLKVGLLGDALTITCAWAGRGNAEAPAAAAAAAAAAPASSTSGQVQFVIEIPDSLSAEGKAAELATQWTSHSAESLQMVVGCAIATAATRVVGDVGEISAALRMLQDLRKSSQYQKPVLETGGCREIDRYLQAAIHLLADLPRRPDPSSSLAAAYSTLIMLAQAAAGRAPFDERAHDFPLPPSMTPMEAGLSPVKAGAVNPVAAILALHFRS